MNIIIPPRIKAKISNKVPPVTEAEIKEAFDNICGQLLIDDREEHDTDPPTLWFVAETRTGRLLKIIFVHRDGNNVVKSAYDANDAVRLMYDRNAK